MHFLALTLLSLVSAAVVPTSPDGSTVVNMGSTLTALWNADTTGTWQNTEIQLMTGDNLNMIALATLATGVDGTTQTSWSGPCPDVSPNSKIYFLQFTQGGDVSTATWTTRFTIADESGNSVPPTNSTVYNGAAVQWGIGELVGGTDNSTSTNGTTPSAAASASMSMAPTSSSTSASVPITFAVGGTSASVAALTSHTASASTSPSPSTSRAAAGKLEAGLGMAVLGMLGALFA